MTPDTMHCVRHTVSGNLDGRIFPRIAVGITIALETECLSTRPGFIRDLEKSWNQKIGQKVME
jgi:hypothetical protein